MADASFLATVVMQRVGERDSMKPTDAVTLEKSCGRRWYFSPFLLDCSADAAEWLYAVHFSAVGCSFSPLFLPESRLSHLMNV